MLSFQDIIMRLQAYWARQGCVILPPYDLEKGAATFHPATCLRCLGKEPWKAAWIEPCRRCKDGRYGENPFRLQHYYQFQVVLKPAPANAQQLYVDSLKELGVDVVAHDLRFVHDDWEAPTQGASGLGWEVWLDGMEVSQYTYFQMMASLECDPVTVEYTYGLERIAMFIQKKDSIFDLVWVAGQSGEKDFTYRDVYHENEVQFSKYNFEVAHVPSLLERFKMYEAECKSCLEKEIVLPAYDHVIKCSHVFNLLDARGAIAATERAGYIQRVRTLARRCGQAYVKRREEMALSGAGAPSPSPAAAAAGGKEAARA